MSKNHRIAGFWVRFLNSVCSGVPVVAPRPLLAVTLSVIAANHAVSRGFRVVVRVYNASAEFNKQDGRTDSYYRHRASVPFFDFYIRVVCPVVYSRLKFRRCDIIPHGRKLSEKHIRPVLQPCPVILDYVNHPLNARSGQRRLYSPFHDTFTLLTAMETKFRDLAICFTT